VLKLLNAAHQHIVPVHLDPFTAMLPVNSQFLCLEPQPCHFFLKITVMYLLRSEHPNHGRKYPERLSNILENSFLSIHRNFDVNCVIKVLVALALIFLQKKCLVNINLFRLVRSLLFNSSFGFISIF